MSVDFLEDFCEKWLHAWNSHNTDTVLDLLDDDIIWEDTTFWTEKIHGKGGVRVYIDKIWEVMHDVKFDERQRFFAPDGCRALVLFRQYGSAPKKVGNGGEYDTHGCDIFMEFKNGRLKHYLASYDILEMMRQMKMLPPRNGKIGGAYVMSLMNNHK